MKPLTLSCGGGDSEEILCFHLLPSLPLLSKEGAQVRSECVRNGVLTEPLPSVPCTGPRSSPSPKLNPLLIKTEET